jgi:hypothetical protein
MLVAANYPGRECAGSRSYSEAQVGGQGRVESWTECADNEGEEQLRFHTINTTVYGRLASNCRLGKRTVRPGERQTLARAQAGEYGKQCDTASSKAGGAAH